MKKRIFAALTLLAVFLTSAAGCSQAPADPVETVQKEVEKPAESNKDLEKQLDWTELQKKNGDIIGWIYIPSTTVNYPILRSENEDDDYYYLRRDLDKNADDYGSIFMERFNDKNFMDPVTVLYGHTSFEDPIPEGKEMFTDLHKYEEEQYLKDNPYIYVYTPEMNYQYQIFCSSIFDNRYILGNYGFVDQAEVQRFTEEVESTDRHWINEDVKLPEKGNYLVLSTCTGLNEDTRLLIDSILINAQENGTDEEQ